MYVTKPLSLFRKDANFLSVLTLEGPYSGDLVVTDEETEAEDTCCWGTCKDTDVKGFPLPQNKIVNVTYTTGHGEHRRTERKKVWFVPVLDQPLSSNRYYVIRATGQHRGLGCTCSREEDMSVCCFSNCVNDVTPRLFDPTDIYQQVEILRTSRGYTARSITPDGFPPHFLRRRGWRVHTSSSYNCQLGEAFGLNVPLRTRLPELISSEPVIVGKWYCPFVFIREGIIKDQMKNSLFYEMTLDQSWEEIYALENDSTVGNVVSVNANIEKEVVTLFGEKAEKQCIGGGVDGFIWFTQMKHNEGTRLGLSLAIVEKMRSIQEVVGCLEGNDREVKVKKVEEFKGGYEWRRFSCFVLVEKFSLRRMDGTVILTCEYKHIHQIRSKWE